MIDEKKYWEVFILGILLVLAIYPVTKDYVISGYLDHKPFIALVLAAVVSIFLIFLGKKAYPYFKNKK